MTSQDWQQKIVFDLWRKKLELLKELTEMSSNVKKVFVKLNWLKSYWAVNFVFSAILLLFLEIWWSLECHIFLTKWGFQKLFSHSSSSLSTLSKLLTCYGISWNLYFAVNLMTSFSRQKPLKSKIQKHTIVGKTKFYYRAKSQLKRLKIEKLVWKRSLFDDSWPGVFLFSIFNMKKLFWIVSPPTFHPAPRSLVYNFNHSLSAWHQAKKKKQFNCISKHWIYFKTTVYSLSLLFI